MDHHFTGSPFRLPDCLRTVRNMLPDTEPLGRDANEDGSWA